MDLDLLDKIQSPSDLRDLNPNQLPKLAQEMRTYMLKTLNRCGGHFGANLGVIELTIVLHYLYNTPEDHLVWDVGHQAYPHKILTGRKNQLNTIRQTDGLTPFPSREESTFDAFGVGHSSTSISAALGMAMADHLQGRTHRSIAVIGDGAMTAGMAFEALNHAGGLHSDFLVILNDNDMSISESVGALSKRFAKFFASKIYASMREGSKKILEKMPPVWEFAKRTELHMKGMLAPGTLFEELGFYYLGPVDGHDIPTLLDVIEKCQQKRGPKLLHVLTTKGKGYSPAEQAQIKYHAVKAGFLDKIEPHQRSKPSFANVFGQWLCDMAEADERLVGITPAMREGSDLVAFSQRFPQRYFDVAIAEQHALTFAAGLACQGLKPVVAIYSTFLQRAYDQLIHDIAIQNLPVLLAIDRAGLVGGDGVTHNGIFDLSYIRCIPNLIIMAPADENECRQMLYTGFLQNQPVAIRYPRGNGPGTPVQSTMTALDIGKAQVRRKGNHIAILAFGTLLNVALEVGEHMEATVVNMRFVKPLDKELITTLAQTHRLIVTLEEHVIAGGAGSAVLEFIQAQQLQCPVLNLGLPDQFIEHGNVTALHQKYKLDVPGVSQAIAQYLEKMPLKNNKQKADTQRG